MKVTREQSRCIDCELCTKACPANIKVHAAARVWSDECTSCYACIEVCPVKDTLLIKRKNSNHSIPSWIIGMMIIGVFIAIAGLAMLTGRWHNSISREEYLRRIQNIESPLYQHNRGEVLQYGPND